MSICCKIRESGTFSSPLQFVKLYYQVNLINLRCKSNFTFKQNFIWIKHICKKIKFRNSNFFCFNFGNEWKKTSSKQKLIWIISFITLHCDCALALSTGNHTFNSVVADRFFEISKTIFKTQEKKMLEFLSFNEENLSTELLISYN